MKNEITNIEELAEAIVAQAGMDYLEYKKELYYSPGHKKTIEKFEEVTKFLHSGYFRLLTDVDADWLITRLDKEFESWKTERENYPYAGYERMC